jgi:hypothetical protein
MNHIFCNFLIVAAAIVAGGNEWVISYEQSLHQGNRRLGRGLPDRLVSPHRNLVIPEGFAMSHRRLEATVADYQAA